MLNINPTEPRSFFEYGCLSTLALSLLSGSGYAPQYHFFEQVMSSLTICVTTEGQ